MIINGIIIKKSSDGKNMLGRGKYVRTEKICSDGKNMLGRKKYVRTEKICSGGGARATRTIYIFLIEVYQSLD